MFWAVIPDTVFKTYLHTILLLFSHHQTVYEGQELNHAFGLCHYKHFLFWNEYRSGSIFKLDTTTGTATLLRNERPPIFEIRMYDAQQQQGTGHIYRLVHYPFIRPC